MNSKIMKELNELKSLINFNSGGKYIDMRQAINYTSLSRSTIRRAIIDGQLTPSKKTGKLLFKVDEINRWLNEKV